MPPLVSYDNGAEALQARLGPKLAKYGIPSKLLFYSWVCSTERDYSYLSQIKQYKTFFSILSNTLTRVLFQAGVPVEALDDFFTAEDVDYIMNEYKELKARPGLAEMMRTLRNGGFEVWCCSDANVDRVKGYFDNAGVEMPLDHILSADMVNAGKPEAAVYKFAREKAGSDQPGEVSVFAGKYSFPCFESMDAKLTKVHQLLMLGTVLLPRPLVSSLPIPLLTSTMHARSPSGSLIWLPLILSP